MLTISVFNNNGDKSHGWELDEKAVKDIKKKSLQFCKEWFLIEGKSAIQSNGIDYGSLLQIKSYFFVEKYLKRVYMMKNITKEENVYINDIYDWRILKLITKKQNIKVKKYISFNNLKDIVKWYGFEYLAKFYSQKRCHNKLEISEDILIQEINNKSMMDMMKALEEKVSDRRFTTICMDNNMFGIARNKNKICIPKKVGYLSLLKFRKKISRLLDNEIFKEKLTEICGDIAVNNMWYEKVFKPAMLNELTGLELYRMSIEDFIAKNNLKNIILPSDSHAISRLVCQVSKIYNIKTMVLQHGSIGELAFTPVYADFFLGWGSICKKIMLNYGEDEKKVIEIGNIKYSKNQDYNKDFQFNKNDIKVLWAVNPVGCYVNKRLFNILNMLLEKNIISKLDIKLHPGNEEKDFFMHMCRESENNKKIKVYDRESNLINLIKENDIVCITQSTTGLEGIMLNKVVCLFNDKYVEEVLPYSQYNSVIDFCNEDEFITKLNSTDIKKLKKNASVFLDEYMRPFDKGKFMEVLNF